MTVWKRRLVPESGEPPDDREMTGLYCRRCLREMESGELYGVGEHGQVLCAACAGEEWESLTEGERLTALGFEVPDDPRSAPEEAGEEGGI